MARSTSTAAERRRGAALLLVLPHLRRQVDGKAEALFLDRVVDDLDPRSTVIVLGDARTNGREPHAAAFGHIAEPVEVQGTGHDHPGEETKQRTEPRSDP